MWMGRWSEELRWKSEVFLILLKIQFSSFMVILIWLLTVILVLNALFLILLVLVQLPKKETGGGLAFGGGATDALIGAGSGNALTTITKYAAGAFLVLAIILTILNTQRSKSTSSGIDKALQQKASSAPPAALPPAQNTATPPTQLVPLATNTLQPVLSPNTNTPNATTQPAVNPGVQRNPAVPASAVGAPALDKPGTPVPNNGPQK
jgi:protein translocase SecG subunit